MDHVEMTSKLSKAEMEGERQDGHIQGTLLARFV